MQNLLMAFAREEQGQDLVEYALITAAVGLALVSTVGELQDGIASVYTSITTGLASIGATGGS